jgi:hypothetical protein
MLNNAGHANGNAIGTEEGTQAEAYDIEGHPFFDMATADCTALFVDGQGKMKARPRTTTMPIRTATCRKTPRPHPRARSRGQEEEEDLQEDRELHGQGGRLPLPVLACNQPRRHFRRRAKGQGLLEKGHRRLP